MPLTPLFTIFVYLSGGCLDELTKKECEVCCFLLIIQKVLHLHLNCEELGYVLHDLHNLAIKKWTFYHQSNSTRLKGASSGNHWYLNPLSVIHKMAIRWMSFKFESELTLTCHIVFLFPLVSQFLNYFSNIFLPCNSKPFGQRS